MNWTYGIQVPILGEGSPGPYGGDPGDTVGFLWEDPAELANGAVVIRAVLGATSVWWGGAAIHGSTDGATYRRVFETRHRSIIGHLEGALAAGSTDYQPGGTVDVHLEESPGELDSTDVSGLIAGVHRAIVGDEILSWMTAILIGVNTYRLTGLYRAWYDTERVAHTAGERFALLDPDQETFEAPLEAVDATWWWKAASMSLGGVEQDLSTVGANWLDVMGRGLHTEFQRGRTRQFIAGETLEFGDHVFLSLANLRAWKATSPSSRRLGLCQSPSLSGWPVAAGEKVYVQTDGLLSDPGGAATPPGAWSWTAGAYLYASGTPGALSESTDGRPPVAMAVSNTEILIFPPRREALRGNQTWTVGTQNADFGDLASAIAAATAGDTILVGRGTFQSATTITVNKRLKIVGSGPYSTILECTGAVGALSVTADDVVVEDLTVQHNVSRAQNLIVSTGLRTLVRNCHAWNGANSTMIGIYLAGITSIILGCRTDGVLTVAAQGRILYSTTTGVNARYGILISASDIMVIGCRVEGSLYDAVLLNGGDDQLILGNWFAPGRWGIYVNPAAPIYRVRIIGNRVSGGTLSGIQLNANANRCIIADNECTLAAQYGINIAAASCNDNLVHGNMVYLNTVGQINDAGTATTLADNVVV